MLWFNARITPPGRIQTRSRSVPYAHGVTMPPRDDFLLRDNLMIKKKYFCRKSCDTKNNCYFMQKRISRKSSSFFAENLSSVTKVSIKKIEPQVRHRHPQLLHQRHLVRRWIDQGSILWTSVSAKKFLYKCRNPEIMDKIPPQNRRPIVAIWQRLVKFLDLST
jgi:hypothetical protein